jgi:hypothetical protein
MMVTQLSYKVSMSVWVFSDALILSNS